MYKLCLYRMTADTGFAPNPFGKYCTLATCMVKLRASKNIVPGTWIVGIGGTTTPVVDKLVYAMRVSEILSVEDYWSDSRFEDKKPDQSSNSPKKWVGDNIYYKKGSKWVQLPSLHSNPDGSQNNDRTHHDINKGKNVLISDHFFYHGMNALPIPLTLQDPIKLRRKCSFSSDYIDRFMTWLKNMTPGVYGLPSMLPSASLFPTNQHVHACEC